METKSLDVFIGSGTVGSGFGFGFAMGSTRGQEFIRLYGSNYSPWAKSVEDYMMAKGKLENAQIRLCMWNTTEPQISSSLVSLTSAKQVWDQVNEMFSRVGNLRHSYNLHQTFFSLTLGDISLKDYYVRFQAVCEEINQSEPISSDVVVMQRQQESMWVASFLSGFDGAHSQILGAKEFPSFSEVFRATLPFVVPSPTDCSALVASIGPSRLSGPYRPPGFGHSRPSRPGDNYPRDGHSFGCGGRDSGGGGCGSSDLHSLHLGQLPRFLAFQSSSTTATLAQTSASTACVATPNPRDNDCGVSAHMTGTSSIMSDISPANHPSHVTLTDGSTSDVTRSAALRPPVDPYQLHCCLGYPSLHNSKKMAPTCQLVQPLHMKSVSLVNTIVSCPPRVERFMSSPFRSLLSFSILPPDPSHYLSTSVPSMSRSPKVPGPSENPLQVYVLQKKSLVAQLLVPLSSIQHGDSYTPFVASALVDPNSLLIALRKGEKGQVCRLCKALYGLQHSPRPLFISYRRLVRQLKYLTITRPKIAFAVSVVSQFMSATPHSTHTEAALRIVRHI
ncbi:hypothetical protein Acr_00g0048770 [Actinidia rufa]|uniref:Retrotransposon gag domain-containing protein n=1 Tax=Actinidia rufa TaxID=165716 RepID=A0A7J0DKA9_9ERIC|nr:hypothetical protein Acr_00g0048770 [Actinidia rufa]